MYTVKLSNGRELKGLGRSYDMFTSEEPLDAGIFAGGLNGVVVEYDGEGEEPDYPKAGRYEHAQVSQVVKSGGLWVFGLRETPERVIEEQRVRADLEYIAMMCGVEL